jgi:hypothetical protein
VRARHPQLHLADVAGGVLGPVELELLVHQADFEVPAFPCTTLQGKARSIAPWTLPTSSGSKPP